MFDRGHSGTDGPPGVRDVCRMLDELDLRYMTDETHGAILLSFRGEAADYDIYILVRQEQAVVYIAIANYLKVPADHENIDKILRRLMELNWEMSLGKAEWDASDGEVRLSYTFTTEDGLGTQALGVVLGYLVAAADRHHDALARLVAA
ncbi:MAG: YbjN domain-containing protein [Armatimonadetes bacterium]|nr:YbjN domain-containing protein [Armatimonadota bacterium]